MIARLEVVCDDLKRSLSSGLRLILLGIKRDILENIVQVERRRSREEWCESKF